MDYKDVFLASSVFTHFDRAAEVTDLCIVRVTKQCYQALKKLGYILSQDELAAYTAKHEYVLNRSKSYGGSDGFTWKELQKFAGRPKTSHDIRMGRF